MQAAFPFQAALASLWDDDNETEDDAVSTRAVAYDSDAGVDSDEETSCSASSTTTDDGSQDGIGRTLDDVSLHFEASAGLIEDVDEDDDGGSGSEAVTPVHEAGPLLSPKVVLPSSSALDELVTRLHIDAARFEADQALDGKVRGRSTQVVGLGIQSARSRKAHGALKAS